MHHYPFPERPPGPPKPGILSSWMATRRLIALVTDPGLTRQMQEAFKKDPAQAEKLQHQVRAKIKELVQSGANPQVHAKAEGGFGKVSLASIALSERQDWLLEELLAQGAQADHTLMAALEKLVAMPLGSSLVRGRENRTIIMTTGQGVIRMAPRNQKMLDAMLQAGFSPETNWDHVRQALDKTVPDHTSFQHPERPLGEVIQERFPLFHAALVATADEQEMDRTIPSPSRAPSPPRPGSRF